MAARLGENSIVLGGQLIAYTVRRSLKARWVRLEIKPGTGLTVVIPRGFPLSGLPEVIKGKEAWLKRMLDRCKLRRGQSKRPLHDGDAVSYLGRRLTVLSRMSRAGAGCVRLDRDCLTADLAGPAVDLGVELERWYRARASEIISAKVEGWSRKLGVKHGRVTIREQRTRWGSCSHQGRLSFNWKLLMAPEPVIDYVVVHELAHLKEMNHSPRFWKIVAAHCPEWRDMRQWLKTHEAEIAAGLVAEAS